jgi:hypothetical protein
MQSDSGSHERFGAHNPEFTVPGLAKESPWNQKSLVRKYPPLKEDTSCDVVVIGAGIAGLSCAYRLVREGKDVVLLESRVRGGGQTGKCNLIPQFVRDKANGIGTLLCCYASPDTHSFFKQHFQIFLLSIFVGRTTAHIMTWLDDYYFECMSMHGDEKTRLVGESLLAAVDWIENTCKEEGIECEFNRVDGILYPHEDSEIKTLEQELDAAHKAGLKDTKMVDLGRGPEVGGIGQALVFPRDADFHPLKYLDGLAEAIVKRGGRIFEGTKAWTVENDVVETEHGKKIRCDHIVLATNSPINHNLAVHARQLPYRSYVVGILCPRSAFARANYWSTEGERSREALVRSFSIPVAFSQSVIGLRNAASCSHFISRIYDLKLTVIFLSYLSLDLTHAEPYTYTRAVDWDKDNYMIIVGGQDHKIGNNPSYDVYAELENHARQRWTGLRETALRWSGKQHLSLIQFSPIGPTLFQFICCMFVRSDNSISFLY